MCPLHCTLIIHLILERKKYWINWYMQYKSGWYLKLSCTLLHISLSGSSDTRARIPLDPLKRAVVWANCLTILYPRVDNSWFWLRYDKPGVIKMQGWREAPQHWVGGRRWWCGRGSQVTVHTATLIRGLHITPSLHPVAGITSPDPVMPHHIWPGLRSHVIVFPTVIFRIVIHHACYHCVGDICCRDIWPCVVMFEYE